MSFEEQERALFDLLFDRSLRENFCQDSTSALEAYKLNGSELNDFREIRSDAIELDAPEEILRSVQTGFQQLLTSAMLEFA